ncbi:mannan endo-1,4-beta-mannosidase [Hamadaea flava]|uniref:Endoglucanase n=1 Tax=Hamadaea flava TaxID=1742688 RepID=A0ABV8LQW9_9ACTN|nr:cellulase family glycosylhydrolase [Hamadaea flava]MCP2322756.1 mannan endo-1,4-beta-mannosidase [Hamadaea flava]
MKRVALASIALLALVSSTLLTAQPAYAATGLHISGRNIVEANGSAFVMRGVSHAHTWYPTQTNSFANIKALGANSLRVVLSGGRWTPNAASDVANVISLCKASKLICVLENHDTTGYGEQSGAYTLDQAVDYWIGLKSVLVGQEDYVVINIGNEPVGNNNAAQWTDATKNAITRLRSNGFQHLIMVDAPNWGQDWQFVMRDNAASVFAADTARNTVFSIHMYGVFDTAAEITAYLDAFQTAGLPLVIGEFGFNHSDGNPDEDTIMAQAVSRGVGYLGWSWSGNGGGVEYLDMVTNFNPSALTSWGQRIFNGANGIVATAREAAIYSGGTSDTVAPTTPGTPTASGVTATGATLSWTASTDNISVTSYDVLNASNTVVASSLTNSVTLTGLTPSTQYALRVRARDAAGNQSAVSSAVTFTTTTAPTGTCKVVYTASPWTEGSGTGGFTANIAVTNTGASAISGWTLKFTLPSGQTLTAPGWSATYTVSGQAVTATNLSYNGNLAAGGSTGIGFNGRWSGTYSSPTSFTLNNNPCTTS